MVEVQGDMHQGSNSDLLEVVFDCLHQVQTNFDINLEVSSSSGVGDRGDYSLACKFEFDMEKSSTGNYSYGEIVEALEEEVQKHPKVTDCNLDL